MARAKKRTEVQTEADTSFNPSEFDPAMESAPAVVATETAPEQSHAAEHAPAGNGHAAAVERKKYTPPADPFGIEGIKGTDNRVHLSQSKADRAWIIRFDKNPNQGEFSKEKPHPVLAYLKSEGFRWGFSDADGQGGWGKLMSEGHYTYAEHMDAQRVLRAAAEMIGAQKQEQAISA